MKINLFLITLVSVFGCSQREETPTRPNILLIVADDLGYGDLGLFGSEIKTPNIDRLAGKGITFTRFHTAPTCAPTRAMLLSGNDNHIAGMGSQYDKTGEWGYEGYLSDRIATIPEVLASAGYHSYMAGKWHLGMGEDQIPSARGFDRTFALMEGAGNHYNGQSVFTDTLSRYRQDGQPVQWKDGEYSTAVYTDKLIEFIENGRRDGQPFFGFAAYTSPHWPLQVDSSFWMKYKGKYDSGYEQLREKRMSDLKEKGFISPDRSLPQLHPSVIPWDSLSSDLKIIEARKMELYAGMVENLDFHVGRLFDYLKSINEFDNTIIIFMSDNGAADEDFYYDSVANVSYHHPYFNNDFENMGLFNSYISYGPQWAESGTAPFKYFKGHASEGGIVTPLIISGSGIKHTIPTDEFTSLLDIAPTIYTWAGVEYPEEYEYPLKGTALNAFLLGKTESIHDSLYVFEVEQSGNVQIRQGNWKLVHEGFPIEKEGFELYNIASDPEESVDLATKNHEKMKEMVSLWEQYRNTLKIITDRTD